MAPNQSKDECATDQWQAGDDRPGTRSQPGLCPSIQGFCLSTRCWFRGYSWRGSWLTPGYELRAHFWLAQRVKPG